MAQCLSRLRVDWYKSDQSIRATIHCTIESWIRNIKTNWKWSWSHEYSGRIADNERKRCGNNWKLLQLQWPIVKEIIELQGSPTFYKRGKILE